MIYKAVFQGRPVNSIGKPQLCVTYTRGDDEESARLELYKRWAHVQKLTLQVVEPTLYKDCVARGIKTLSYHSDLYVPNTALTLELCKFYGRSFTMFRNQLETGWWLDVAFAYDPWWEAREPIPQTNEANS
jgi:hypothetical protein